MAVGEVIILELVADLLHWLQNIVKWKLSVGASNNINLNLPKMSNSRVIRCLECFFFLRGCV